MTQDAHWLRSLYRGFSKRCPRCGVGGLFSGWHTVRPCCPACGLAYEPLDGDSWWFMYLSTAFLSGLIIVGMILIVPSDRWAGRSTVLAIWIVFVLLSLPRRKGLAIAIDYLVDRRQA